MTPPSSRSVPPQSCPVSKLVAGSRRLQSMQENFAHDQAWAAEQVKQAKPWAGAPSTLYAREIWSRRFKEYMSLDSERLSSTPTADDIMMFAATIVRYLVPNHLDKPLLNVRTLREGIRHVQTAMETEHDAYVMRPSDQGRIEGLLAKFVEDGLLFKGRWRKHEWVGHTLITHMGNAWLEEALNEGCPSWDVRISKLLSVVMMGALDCRAGDLVRSSGYKGEEYMQWRHIEITIRGQKDLENLNAKVTIAYEKGHKTDANIDRIRILKTLTNVGHNAVCPIKLLLAHALRHNLVEGSTLEEILEHAWARFDKTIQWTRPREPLIPACEKSLSQFLDLQKPAGPDQVESTVRQMSLGSGILAKIIPHDIRRGGARDLSHLPKDQVWGGVAHEGIAAALGHSLKSFQSGLTQEYVGPINTDLNSLKAANPYDDPMAPIVGEGLRRRITPKEQVDEYCRTNNWDPSSRSHRDAASKRIRKAAEDAHIESQKSKHSTEVSSPSRRRSRDTAFLQDNDELAEQQPHRRQRLTSEDEEAWTEDSEDLSDEVGEAVAMDTIMSLAFRQSTQDDPLRKPGPEFVQWLSRINVTMNRTLYTNQKKLDAYFPTHVPMGNSRDYPTLFTFKCPREKEGCIYSTHDPLGISRHIVECSSIQASTFSMNQSPATAPRFPCRHTGCPKYFSSERYMEVHVADTHEWTPKQCPVASCNNTEWFANGGKYKRHAGTHRKTDWMSRKCGYPGCNSQHDWEDRHIYKRHLKTKHKLGKAAQALYLQ